MLTTTELLPTDREAILEIAIDFWPHYYPGGIQSLVTQLFGREAPGSKYSLKAITNWLESQQQVIQERIWKLIAIKFGNAIESIATTEALPVEKEPEAIIGKLAILSGEKPWEKNADDYFTGKKVIVVGEDCDGNYLVRLADDNSLEPCLYRTTRKWLAIISPRQNELFDRMELAQSREELLYLAGDEIVKSLLKLANYKTRNKFAGAINFHNPQSSTKPNRKRKQRAA